MGGFTSRTINSSRVCYKGSRLELDEQTSLSFRSHTNYTRIAYISVPIIRPTLHGLKESYGKKSFNFQVIIFRYPEKYHISHLINRRKYQQIMIEITPVLESISRTKAKSTRD